VYSNLLAGLVN